MNKKFKIKVGDKVTVIAGKDKGKTGKVTQILPELDKVVIDGVNVMYKHVKGRKSGEKGQRIEFNGPIHSSNVMLICPQTSKPTRIGIKLGENKQRSRISKKSKEIID
ncbi:50S ribosomal protein L24 [Patescibacteria group bacterium]|jgi:large subunit ribosomal protein L24|nr:50S ribosomal protein L24 [Patescibacteria group bacterium]